MSLKSALAGLPYGGAKAALIFPENGIKDRQKYFEAYGAEVEKLVGKFVTGTDVGLTNADLDFIKNKTRYVIGHGVESGYYTAIGVLGCVKEVFEHIFGSKSLVGKSFAVQGVGKTGGELVKLLVAEGVKDIYVADIEKDRISQVKNEFPFVKVVSENEIHKCSVDVFSPSALSGVLNDKTVEELNCKAVIGSANNQLADKKIVELLEKRGIIYVPDYLANSGGIISVVDQFLNIYPDEDRIKDRIKKIPENLSIILNQSKSSKESLEKIANDLAHKILAAA
jgi:leucine dehydrogenase